METCGVSRTKAKAAFKTRRAAYNKATKNMTKKCANQWQKTKQREQKKMQQIDRFQT